MDDSLRPGVHAAADMVTVGLLDRGHTQQAWRVPQPGHPHIVATWHLRPDCDATADATEYTLDLVDLVARFAVVDGHLPEVAPGKVELLCLRCERENLDLRPYGIRAVMQSYALGLVANLLRSPLMRGGGRVCSTHAAAFADQAGDPDPRWAAVSETTYATAFLLTTSPELFIDEIGEFAETAVRAAADQVRPVLADFRRTREFLRLRAYTLMAISLAQAADSYRTRGRRTRNAAWTPPRQWWDLAGDAWYAQVKADLEKFTSGPNTWTGWYPTLPPGSGNDSRRTPGGGLATRAALLLFADAATTCCMNKDVFRGDHIGWVCTDPAGRLTLLRLPDSVYRFADTELGLDHSYLFDDEQFTVDAVRTGLTLAQPGNQLAPLARAAQAALTV